MSDDACSYITIAEAAARLSVNHKTIRKLLANGTLTGVRIANTPLIRLPLAEVDALLRPLIGEGSAPAGDEPEGAEAA